MQDNILVVVRSVEERTTEVCAQLMSHVVPAAHIKVIHAQPFSKAIRKSLQLAIDSTYDWVACVDADVLVSPGRTLDFFSQTSTTPAHVFCLQSLILDKFFFVARPSGIHLYRSAFAQQALNFIPEEGVSLRPESFMLTSMAKAGFPYQQHGIIVGIHDYEQFYSDIYRKCFLQAHKHAKHIDNVIGHWERLAETDVDFRVALAGMHHGRRHQGKVLVDKDFIKEEINQFLHTEGIIEKETHINRVPEVEAFIATYIKSKEWTELQEKMYPRSRWNELVDQSYLASQAGKQAKVSNSIIHKVSRGLKKLKSFLS